MQRRPVVPAQRSFTGALRPRTRTTGRWKRSAVFAGRADQAGRPVQTGFALRAFGSFRAFRAFRSFRSFRAVWSFRAFWSFWSFWSFWAFGAFRAFGAFGAFWRFDDLDRRVDGLAVERRGYVGRAQRRAGAEHGRRNRDARQR